MYININYTVSSYKYLTVSLHFLYANIKYKVALYTIELIAKEIQTLELNLSNKPD